MDFTKDEDGEIEHVSEFQYLGSIIAENGFIDTEIDRHIAKCFQSFWYTETSCL